MICHSPCETSITPGSVCMIAWYILIACSVCVRFLWPHWGVFCLSSGVNNSLKSLFSKHNNRFFSILTFHTSPQFQGNVLLTQANSRSIYRCHHPKILFRTPVSFFLWLQWIYTAIVQVIVLLYFIIPHHSILSYPILSYPILSYPILSYPISLSHPLLLCLILLYTTPHYPTLMPLWYSSNPFLSFSG